MTEARFYVELPADEYGNTGRPRAVVQATVEPWPDPYSPGREQLVISAPQEIAARWPSVVRDVFGGWKEVDGPARMLTREEWATLTGWQS